MKTVWILFLCVSSIVNAQWKYKSDNDPFDGDYKTAYVVGDGRSPYNEPMFVINKFSGRRNFNVFITNFGYTGCDPNTLEFSFGDGEVYTAYDVNDNTDRDALFINQIRGIDMYSFIKLLMEKSKMYVRHSNDCGINRMEFSLSGSSNSIKRVIGDWLADNEKVHKEKEKVIDELIEYYKGLDCDSEFDSNTPVFIEKLSASTNIFQTNTGPNIIEVGTIVQYFNTEGEKYPFKIRAINGDKVEEYYVDPDTAIYITENNLAIREMLKGMNRFRRIQEDCD
ncbi:hypothetical protein [Allomuricauda sp.]|uniref:hypothetical protein n=1 Tax=Flagellimonas alginolytica TaxID=3177515 RepID=UPI0025FA9B71|nr:hypothetical protein [Allomuricauda sp.]